MSIPDEPVITLTELITQLRKFRGQAISNPTVLAVCVVEGARQDTVAGP